MGASLLGVANAQAQCVSSGDAGLIGVNLAPLASGGSVNSLVAAINTVNTAFLTQSTAFISAPDNPAPGSTGGGVWARGVGGEVNTHSTSAATVTLGGVPLSGGVACSTHTRMDFTGTQIGTDTSILNWNGWNLHGGSTVGYIGADIRDVSTGGSFADNLQVPFAGLYGVVTKGGFFADAQIRMDDYQNKVSDYANGVFGQHYDARGIAVNGNIGYNYALPQNWFIEPSLGFVWSRVSVDPLNVSGTFVLQNQATGISPPGTIYVSPIYSAIGRASLRTGTTFVWDKYTLTPFVTASIFREFEDSVTTRFQSNFDNLGLGPLGISPIAGTVRTSNLGTWGQIGLGMAARINNTGWLGYLRGDYRFGDHYDGWSLVGGVRYQFSPEEILRPRITKGPLTAAAEPAVYNWTGYKIGVHIGVDSGHSRFTFPDTGNSTYPRFSGIMRGGQIGYDYQFAGKWVAGAFGDFAGTNAHGARACPGMYFFTCEFSQDWLATAGLRLGYAYWDRVLIYGKAGVAVGRTSERTPCNTGTEPTLIVITGCAQVATASRTSAGWMIGGGTEFALNDRWSVTADTKYFNLGEDRFVDPLGPINIRRDGVVSTIGVNYKFNFAQTVAPVVAKY